MTDSNAFKQFKQAAEQFTQSVPVKYRDCGNERDFPVPSGHAPVLVEGTNEGYVGILVQERDGEAWIHCENPWSVER